MQERQTEIQCLLSQNATEIGAPSYTAASVGEPRLGTGAGVPLHAQPPAKLKVSGSDDSTVLVVAVELLVSRSIDAWLR